MVAATNRVFFYLLSLLPGVGVIRGQTAGARSGHFASLPCLRSISPNALRSLLARASENIAAFMVAALICASALYYDSPPVTDDFTAIDHLRLGPSHISRLKFQFSHLRARTALAVAKSHVPELVLRVMTRVCRWRSQDQKASMMEDSNTSL